MNWITGALLALYLFFCGFYAWVLARRSGSAHKGALCLAASLALPVAGPLFVWFCDSAAAARRRDGYTGLCLGADYRWDDPRRLHRADTAREADRVPMDEALTLSDKEYRRALVMELLNAEAPLAYLDVLRRALDNEDGETSHYASVAIMELRRKVQQQLAAAQTRWQRDPADPDAAAAWEQLLYRAATCDLYDAYSRRRYTARYRALSGRLLRDKKPRSRYLHHRVRLELQQGDLVKARQVCERYLALYPHSEQAVRDRLELYIQARDAAGLQGFLGTLPQRPVLLTTKTLDLVRAFRNEGSSEQDL